MRAAVLSIFLIAAVAAGAGAASATGNLGAAAGLGAAELDLTVLRTRIERTSALGLMTKIELRGRVQGLVDAARSLATRDDEAWKQLRTRYDQLVDRLIALLAEEPELHDALRGARERIWRELLRESPPGGQARLDRSQGPTQARLAGAAPPH